MLLWKAVFLPWQFNKWQMHLAFTVFLGSLILPKGLRVVSSAGKPSLPAAGDGKVCMFTLCCLGTQLFVFCALNRLKNETAANEVLASIQSYFRSQPFDFRGAQIISGQEEGVYGWITANYLMGNFLEVCGNKCMVFISSCLSLLQGVIA